MVGIRDPEVRVTVRLRLHTSLKEAVAYTLDVEAVLLDTRALKSREFVTTVRILAWKCVFDCLKNINVQRQADAAVYTSDRRAQ